MRFSEERQRKESHGKRKQRVQIFVETCCNQTTSAGQQTHPPVRKYKRRRQERRDLPMSKSLESPKADATHTADYLLRCITLSWQMEMDRYESLSSSVGKLITSISIIAVAVMTAAGLVSDAFAKHGQNWLLATLCLFVLCALIASLIIALCSQFRFEYKALNSPEAFADCVREYSSDFNNSKEAALQFAKTIEEPYNSLRSRNDKIRKLLSAAIVCLLIAVGLIVIGTITGIAALNS